MPSSRALLLTLLVLVTPAALASAQGTTVVHVHVTDREAHAAEASVQLVPEGGGDPQHCVTRDGACDIRGVAPGRYVVTATPRGEGRPPLPRVVPVPAGVPSMELHVRLL